jgi:hypothetical protein
VRCRVCLGAAAALVAAAAPLAAQQVAVRVGGVRARYADTVSGSAASLTGRVVWGTPSVSGAFSASYTRFTVPAWAVQGAAHLVAVGMVSRHLGIGLGLQGDGGYLTGGIWSGMGSGGPLVAFASGDWLLLGGASVGGVRRVDSTADMALTARASVRRDLGPVSLEAGVNATRGGPTRFADATLSVSLHAAALAVTGLAGARSGDLANRPWLQGRVSYRIVPWARLEAQAGTYPRDLSGFTGGSFVSVGVWLDLHRWGGMGGAGVRGVRAPPSVVVEPAGPGRQQVTFRVPGANSVSIAGEWNEWTPVPLEPLGDARWRATLALRQGVHRYSLVVDGDRWVLPRGVATLPDDLGGQVALLVIHR